MPLAAELSVHLDVSGPLAAFTDTLGQSLGDLDSIAIPLDEGAQRSAAEVAAGIGPDRVRSAAGRVAAALQPLAARVPGAGEVLPTVETGVRALEQVADPDLQQRIEALLGGLGGELGRGREGAIGGVLRILELVRTAPEAELLQRLALELERLASGGAPVSPTAFAGFSELLPAISGAAAAIAAMARLDSLLAEAERVAGFAALQLDPAGLAALETEITTRLGDGDGASLIDFISRLDPADAAAVAAAAREVEAVSARLGLLVTTLRDGMAFGDATLVYLDPTGLRPAVDALRAEVRGADLAPLERTVQALAGRLAGIAAFDLRSAPARSLDELLDEVEGQVERLAEGIGTVDIATLLGPIGEGLAFATGVPGQLADALAAAADKVGAALDEVRDGVRALPLDEVAGQVREVAAVIARTIDTLSAILGGIEDAIRTAADRANDVLAAAEAGLDQFETALETGFAAARATLAAADVDGVVAEVQANLQNFQETVARADLAPYFDTAADAVNGAAGVVEKVPFELLPDSMEQEVVDAIRPVKAVDADAVRARIEATLAIEDGRFGLGDVLLAAVADIDAKVKELLLEVRRFDPELLAAPLAAPIDELRAKVEAFQPGLEVGPLRDALQAAKNAVGSLDPAALLAPVEQAFDELLAAIDRLSPAALVAPLDARLDQARERALELSGLRTWRDQLDAIEAEATRLIGLLDLTALEKDLTRALRAFQDQLADEPRLGLADALLALLAPVLDGGPDRLERGAFDRIAAWLDDSAGASGLLARTTAIRSGIEATSAAVAAGEPAALAARLQPRLAALRLSIEGLPAGPARLRLETALAVDVPLTELAAMQTPWRRYRDALETAGRASRDLGAEGFSEVQLTVQRLGAAAAPLAPLRDLARNLLRPLGLTRLDRGLTGLLEELFETAPPRRLVQIATPLLSALRGRLEALLTAVLDPFRNAIDDLLRAVEVFDLSPFKDRLQAITDALKAEIEACRPTTLLAEPLTALGRAREAILAFDPLAAIVTSLDRLKTRIAGLLGRLDVAKLLAEPIRLFAEIIGTLEALELERLLQPVVAQLDVIAAQVEGGLEETFGAFKRLQDALPDRVGSTSVGASVTVSA